jgi:Domain of unknown function (DUF4936)
MRELYIYYRVDPANAAAAQAAVTGLQSQLRKRHPALTARLLHRPETTDGRQTWMETYSTDALLDAAGVGAALQAAIEAGAAAYAHLIDGTRHTEVFFACAS